MLFRFREPIGVFMSQDQANIVVGNFFAQLDEDGFQTRGPQAIDGRRVHVERLQCDLEYASTCLAQGAASPIPALRVCALRLAGLLHITLPGA